MMKHPSELTSEEALRYLIECSLMSGTNAAKAGAIERLRADIQALTDMRTLRDYAASCAGSTLGAQLSLVVSGNGEAWRVFLNEEPMTDLSCKTPFDGALHEAAERIRKNGPGTSAKPSVSEP